LNRRDRPAVPLARGTRSLKAGIEVRRDRFNVSGKRFTRGEFAIGEQARPNPASRPGAGHGFAGYPGGPCPGAAAAWNAAAPRHNFTG